MRSLADIKRRCTIGTVLRLVWHRYAEQWREPDRTALQTGVGVTRSISVVQTNAIALKRPDGRDSWLYWPKAANVRIDGPDTFTILDDGADSMRYEFVSPEVPHAR